LEPTNYLGFLKGRLFDIEGREKEGDLRQTRPVELERAQYFMSNLATTTLFLILGGKEMANALPRPGARLRNRTAIAQDMAHGHKWTSLTHWNAPNPYPCVRITGKGGYILMCWVDLGKKRQAT